MGESEVGGNVGIVGVAIGTKAAAGDVRNSEAVATKTSDKLVDRCMVVKWRMSEGKWLLQAMNNDE